jgi:site-specific recombinase XerD
MIENDEFLSPDELEKVSIKNLTIDDAGKVDTQMIIDFLAYTKSDRKNNSSTRNRKLSAIKSFYKHAYNKKHLISKNPAADIDGIRGAKSLSKFLTIEEATNLLSTVYADAESKTRVRDYSIIALFLNTGMRLSELCGLNIQSFDPDITFVKVLGKGNKERMIYLNNACISALNEYLPLRNQLVSSDEPALFISKQKKRISKRRVQQIVESTLNSAGLDGKGITTHKLRHTAATLMYQYGEADVLTLKEVLGHSSISTTEIYTHLSNEIVRNAFEGNPLANQTSKKEK